MAWVTADLDLKLGPAICQLYDLGDSIYSS